MALRAIELRLGNYIERKRSSDRQPEWVKTTVNLDYLGLVCLFPKDYRPIPLTEEWLEKSGFEKGEDCDYEKDGFKLWAYGEGMTGFYHINSELLLYFDNVHDIQNGWKVIMEEELTIKELAE